jgi:beta-xylosidase
MNLNVGVQAAEWYGDLFGGTFILRSLSGEPEGPYEPTTAEGPLTDLISAQIFEDDDGTLYFVWQQGTIGRLTDGMDALVDVRHPWEKPFDPEPVREGVHLFKRGGRYHLAVTAWSWRVGDRYTYCHTGHREYEQLGTYDVLVASSDSPYGPWDERYTSITDGGLGRFFEDKDGNWWGCVFLQPRGVRHGQHPFTEKPALVSMEWLDGRIHPRQ